MNINKIGNLIARQRIAKNLTQEQLAEKLGVLRTTISKWERGINTPDISLLQPLCQELDLTFTELINGEKNISNKDNTITAIDAINFYNKKTKNKYLIVSINIIFLLFCFFLSLIIINNYNKFTMYEIHTTKNDFTINGYLLESINKKGIFIQNIIYNNELVGTDQEIITDSVTITLESNNNIIYQFKKISNDRPERLYNLLYNTSIYIDSDKVKKIDLNNLYLKIEFEDNQKTQNNTIDLSINN